MERRDLLKGGLVLAATGTAAAIYAPRKEGVLTGGQPWKAPPTVLPQPVDPSKRVFFSESEARTVGAIFDRLIPADEVSIGASEAGCVTFTDYQLAGPYGSGKSRYSAGPFQKGDAYQGDQTALSPADWYKRGIAAIDAASEKAFGKAFVDLSPEQQDDFLKRLEAGKIALAGGLDPTKLFQQFLGNVREGYLADPIYGGNRGMAGWKMVGFPGALYDYRDYVGRKGERLDIAPVSLIGPVGPSRA